MHTPYILWKNKITLCVLLLKCFLNSKIHHEYLAGYGEITGYLQPGHLTFTPFVPTVRAWSCRWGLTALPVILFPDLPAPSARRVSLWWGSDPRVQETELAGLRKHGSFSCPAYLLGLASGCGSPVRGTEGQSLDVPEPRPVLPPPTPSFTVCAVRGKQHKPLTPLWLDFLLLETKYMSFFLKYFNFSQL